MHWTIIDVKLDYYVPQAILKLWCPDISFSRIPRIGPVLYPAKNEEFHSIISYLIFPRHFMLLLRRNLHHVGHIWIALWVNMYRCDSLSTLFVRTNKEIQPHKECMVTMDARFDVNS